MKSKMLAILAKTWLFEKSCKNTDRLAQLFWVSFCRQQQWRHFSFWRHRCWADSKRESHTTNLETQPEPTRRSNEHHTSLNGGCHCRKRVKMNQLLVLSKNHDRLTWFDLFHFRLRRFPCGARRDWPKSIPRPPFAWCPSPRERPGGSAKQQGQIIGRQCAGPLVGKVKNKTKHFDPVCQKNF